MYGNRKKSKMQTFRNAIPHQAVQIAQARHDELLAARVPDAVAHHAGPSSAQIASATRRPSTADETIPPA